jgi:hypothetical protein
MPSVVVGDHSHTVSFYHPTVGWLSVQTGMDAISWGYTLNTANFPTYGGEVVQILSCYVEDLTVQGTVRNYTEMEAIYAYFLNYIRGSAADGVRNETPMKFYYPHRGWDFDLIVTDAVQYRKARDLTVPEWKLSAFVVDDAGDVDSLKDLILSEAEIKTAIGFKNVKGEPAFDENFGLQGVIRFVDDNPFSDPFTHSGLTFQTTDEEALKHLSDYYSSLLPNYLNGDFDSMFGSIGSEPSFNPTQGVAKGVKDNTSTNQQAVKKAAK